MLPQGASFSNDGGILGGMIAYDQEINGIVVGVVGDLSWTSLGDNDTIVFQGNSSIGMPPITFATQYKLKWLSTMRGRVGVPFDTLLIYATGGLAFGEVSLTSKITVGDPPMGSLNETKDETKVGWTVGGGGEVALSEHLIATAEVLYFD